MKKLLSAFILALVAFAPSAFANSVQGGVTANVPSTCEITAVDAVHAEFGLNVSTTSASGNIHVVCNKDAGYSISSPTVNADGRFTIPAISGTAGATMQVEVRESVTGNALNSGDLIGGTGTGLTQFIGFQLVYNPLGGGIPAYGFYSGQWTVDLTSSF